MASSKRHEWSVSVPLDDLLELIRYTDSLEQMREDNKQLRRELEGLRNMFTELQMAFGDVKRELMKR